MIYSRIYPDQNAQSVICDFFCISKIEILVLQINKSKKEMQSLTRLMCNLLESMNNGLSGPIEFMLFNELESRFHRSGDTIQDAELIKKFIKYCRTSLCPHNWNLRWHYDMASNKVDFLSVQLKYANHMLKVIQFPDTSEDLIYSLAQFVMDVHCLCIEFKHSTAFQAIPSYERSTLRQIILMLPDFGNMMEFSMDFPVPEAPDTDLHLLLEETINMRKQDKIQWLLEEMKILDDAEDENLEAGIDNTTCAICLESLAESVYPYSFHMQSGCLKHKFHHSCIGTWLHSTFSKCPCCRQ